MTAAISERTRAVVLSVMSGRTPFVERRSQKRFLYPFEQRFAPIVNGHLPGKADLRPMVCHDLSASGIAFFSKSVPEPELVLELGVDGKTRYLKAVVRGCALDVSRGEYLVRCEFTSRLATLAD